MREDYARLEELNKDLQQQIKNKSLTILDLQDKIQKLKRTIFDEKEEKEKQKQLDQYEETFEKLDNILLTNEDREKGKEYLKRFEILERVSNLSKLVDKYKRAFDEFSKLLEKPKQTFNGIRLAIIDKLNFGGKSSGSLVNKVSDQVNNLKEKSKNSTSIKKKKNKQL